MSPTSTPPDKARALLDQIAAIRTMERGKLTAEFRPRADAGGDGPAMLGPYYKLQVWEEGRNRSRRVPASEVAALREDLANHTRFTELAAAYAGEIIARTRALRREPAASSEAAPGEAADAKKNSRVRPGGKGSWKRKPSSPPRARA